jgi:hypothetical protein
MSVIISMDFFTKFLRITRRILFCWRDSLEMLRGRSSESTTPCKEGEGRRDEGSGREGEGGRGECRVGEGGRQRVG